MSPYRTFLLALAGLLMCGAALAADTTDPLYRMVPAPADQPIPVADFFRPPLFRDPAINDAGDHFAAIVTDAKHDREELLVVNIKDGKFEELMGPGGTDVFNYHWLDDTHLLCRLSKEKLYAYGTMVAEVGDLSNAYYIEAHNALQVLGVPRRDRMAPVIWLRENAWDEGRDYGAMRIDARERLKGMAGFGRLDSSLYPYGTEASVLDSYPAPPSGTPFGYSCDKNGELAYAFTQVNGYDTLWVFRKGAWVRSPVNLDDYDFLCAGDKPGEVIMVAPERHGEPREVCRMNALTGRKGEVLYQDKRYDPLWAWFYRDPVTLNIIGMKLFREGLHAVWFTKDYEFLQNKIERSFPVRNSIIDIMGSNRAQTDFVVSASSDVMPTAYYSVNLEKGRIGLIKSTRPWIDPKRMLPMRVVNYKARDGKMIQGYVTLPAGASRRHPVPMVVLPHGGPWVRDVWGWNPEVQFLASRGYAVFQPNYRGSTGFGWEFSEADRWDFAKMSDDVTDGVHLLLKTGLIDRHRVAIMGGSFGAYLALYGAENEPGLYRCAVAIAGVFDFAKVMRDAKWMDDNTNRFDILKRHLGDPAKNKARFDEISPLRHVDRLKIPVFVAHGKDDRVADVSESRDLVAQLEKYHVPVESHFVGGEGHGFSYFRHRIEIYTDIEAFLAKNLAPQAKK